MSTVDPDLIGIWIVRGESRTYEVAEDGTYHIADPEAPLSFENGSLRMIWGDRVFDRLEGAGGTPFGRWKDESGQEIWAFEEDGAYSVSSDDITDTGIWALRDGGAALWCREYAAEIESNGAQITFRPVGGQPVTYGYTVSDGVWVLLDTSNWTEVARYLDPSRLG